MGVRVGGEVAAFVLVFSVNPPSLMVDTVTSREMVSTYYFCKEGNKSDKYIGEDVVSVCESAQTAFPDHYLTDFIKAKLAVVRCEESAKYHIAKFAMLVSLSATSDGLKHLRVP